MRATLLRIGPILTIVLATTSAGETREGYLPTQNEQSQTAQPCNVTEPNNVIADGGEPNRGSFGNSKLSLGPFGLWKDGTVVFRPGGAGFVTPEGWLGMKFGWQRSVRGRVTVTGRRVDGPAPPLRAESGTRRDTGFQATYLIFTTPGCWEVTGSVGDASLTFITRVEKIGDGPAWRRAYRKDLSIVPAP